MALSLSAAGVLAAALMAIGRTLLVRAEGATPRLAPAATGPDALAGQDAAAGPQPPADAKAQLVAAWRRLISWAMVRAKDLWRRALPFVAEGDAFTGWMQTAVTGAAALLIALGIIGLLRRPPEPELPALTLRVYGALLIVFAFPLLILERIFANLSAERLPEAPQSNRLVRVPLAVALWLGSELVFLSLGFAWASKATIAPILLLLAVALEMIGRSAALLFIPFPPAEARRSAADSRLAGALLRLKWPSIREVNTAVRRQFGVDLSRSWALAFVRKAAAPVALGLALLAWCLSGVTALGVNQRGVYEVFGAPVAVFGSGVHVHLPWPIGVIRPVENGVVHQLPIEFLLPNGARGEPSDASEPEPKIVGAEDHPSEGSDRLWTGDHPFEGSYLIASEEDGRQSFQLVDTDMAVVYRVGNSNQAALDAAYRLEKPDDLIQAVSGQLLVRYFVQHQLLDLLAHSRKSFARTFQTQLQQQLDSLSSGLEVLSVSIEAIHPPPGAANAYHDVQAAEIRAKSAVFTSQASAISVVSAAQQTALRAVDDAQAGGAELVGQAQSDAIAFDADRKSYAYGAAPFVLERRLAAITRAFGKSPSAIIIDHRLRGVDAPTLDLRYSGAAGGQPAPATSAVPSDDGD